jgi:uncharacterized membrane protein YedE/YeeE
MKLVIALIAGMLFGGGLVVSGMTDTAKVQGWLDVFGAWDPTLAFVMGGAMIPMAIAWVLTKGRSPMTGGNFPAPPEPKLGRNLIVGSVYLVWVGPWRVCALGHQLPQFPLAEPAYGFSLLQWALECSLHPAYAQ